MKYILVFLVYLLALTSISTLILHNEIVIETSSSTASSSSSPSPPPSPSSSDSNSNHNDKSSNTESAQPVVINTKQPEASSSPDNEKENKKSVVVVAEPEAANDVSSSSSSSGDSVPIDVPSNNMTTSNQTTSPESSSVEPSASSTPNQTQAEIVRAAGAVVVNKAEMQSFEEWKEMKLKSGGETENEPTGSSSSSSSSSSSGSSQDNSDPASTSPLSQQNVIKLMGEVGSTAAASSAAVHRRKNYASAECGAKIIASNPEANKPSNILSESKDDYMLNSCTNRIWFVIELCEPVRITEFELANFELFSNVPRQFRVYASERYLPSSPTSNWQQKYLIGTFEAANVRTEQKFSIKDTASSTTTTTTTTAKNNGEQSASQSNSNGGSGTNGVDSSSSNTNGTSTEQQQQQQSSRQPAILMYAKYVRFEMISHYGKEHYCPLSLVRVFGTSITDEEEAASPDSAEAILLGGSGAHHDTIVDALLSTGGDEAAKSKSSEQAAAAAEKQSSKSQDFLDRLVSEKDKLISNIIATFLGENFNLSKLFTLFSFNTDQKIAENNTNNNNNSKSHQEQNETAPAAVESSLFSSPTATSATNPSISSQQTSKQQQQQQQMDTRRNLVLQIDLHKVLCFSSIRNSSDCCQCLPEDIMNNNNNEDEMKKKNTNHSNKRRANRATTMRPSLRERLQAAVAMNTSNNWMSKYCGYYFLMMTSAQAQLNTSLLFKFLNNIMFSRRGYDSIVARRLLNDSSSLTDANFTRFSLNNIDYYILNEWLDNQTASVNFYFGKKPLANLSKSNNDTNKNQQNPDDNNNNKETASSSTPKNFDKLSEDQSNLVEIDTQLASPSPRDDSQTATLNDDVSKIVATSETTTTTTPTNEVEEVIPSIINETSGSSSSSSSGNGGGEAASQQTSDSSVDPETGVNGGASDTPSVPSTSTSTSTSSTTTTTTSTITVTQTANTPSPATVSQQIPTVVAPVIIGNGKDAVLMRLSNRVKILELNMTLSSQYLEKLSQHYRKQMDEMQRAFNVTTSALLETMRIADERDLKQNERIGSIEKRVERMQQSIDALDALLTELKFQTDILIWTIIFIMSIIIMVEILRWLTSNFQSSKRAPRREPLPAVSVPAASPPTPVQVVHTLTSAEIEALIEDRLKSMKENLRLEMEAFKQGLVADARSAAAATTTTTTRIESLGSSSSLTGGAGAVGDIMGDPNNQRTAAAAAVVSSTLATVVALAAATAQCNPLNSAAASAEEKI